MTEPSGGVIVAAGGSLPAVAALAADPRPYAVYLSTLASEESRRTMAGCLGRIAGMFGKSGSEFAWHHLRYEHTSAIRAMVIDHPKEGGRHGEKWSPSHANKHLSALRGVLRQCWKLGLVSAEDYQRARDIDEVSAHREPAGRSIHSDELAALLGTCEADENVPLGIRDGALLAFLYSTGVRRAEAASGLIERYDARERSLKVIGKGDKERTVYLIQEAAMATGRWLALVGERRGPIFRPVDRWGNIAPRHLSARAIGLIVSGRQAQAGVAALSTHDFRRTLGGDFLDAGGDLAQLQQLFGHSSATTTAGYDRRPGRKLRAAVDELSLPSPDQISRKERRK